MAVRAIALWYTLYENDFIDTKPMFQVPLCFILGIPWVALRITKGAPIQNHGARAVEFQIAALMHDVYLIQWHIKVLSHSHRH
jgi:hypothetical protein